jgi:hypothetical protein
VRTRHRRARSPENGGSIVLAEGAREIACHAVNDTVVAEWFDLVDDSGYIYEYSLEHWGHKFKIPHNGLYISAPYAKLTERPL